MGPSAISKLRLSSRSFLRAVRLGHSLPPFPAHLVLGSHPSPSPSPPLLLLVPTIHRSRGEERKQQDTEAEKHAQEEEEVGKCRKQEGSIVTLYVLIGHTPFSPSHFPFPHSPLGSFTTTHTATTTNQPTWVVLRFCRFRVLLLLGVFEWPRSGRHVQGRLSFVCTGP